MRISNFLQIRCWLSSPLGSVMLLASSAHRPDGTMALTCKNKITDTYHTNGWLSFSEDGLYARSIPGMLPHCGT